MIVEERPPGLGRWVPPANHVFTYAGFTDLDADLQQFAVDAWSAPVVGDARTRRIYQK